MLPKKNRNDRKAIEKLFRGGRAINSQNLTLKFMIAGSGPPRISFIVPKAVSKKPTRRNFLRRRGYGAIGGELQKLPAGFRGVFVFKSEIDNIENEIKTTLDKLH